MPSVLFDARIEYPLLVTDTIDTVCESCQDYPAINFCKGPKAREEDREAARILGIEIGRRYRKKELAGIFRMRAEEQGMDAGVHHDRWQ